MFLELENATDPQPCEKKVYHNYSFVPSSIFSFQAYLHLGYTDPYSGAGTGEKGKFTDPTAQDKPSTGGGGWKGEEIILKGIYSCLLSDIQR